MKERIYEWLTREFTSIAILLNDEERTELDGKLWKIAGELEELDCKLPER